MIPRTRRQIVKFTPWTFTESFFFAAFLFWSAAGLIFTFTRLTPAEIGRWHLPPMLENFIDLCIYNGDPILIILAFFNTHLHAARQWTAGVARRWAFTILLCSYLFETVGTLTSLPFGDYHYTDKFGPSVWPGSSLLTVPITIPIAWHVIITNALFLVRAVAPHLSGFAEALTAGAICTAYDFILEPFATQIKGYWIWAEGSVPLINYIAWFVLSALLIKLFAPTLSSRFRYDIRPATVIACTVLIFLAGEFATRLYR
jgi:putative membrane protein